VISIGASFARRATVGRVRELEGTATDVAWKRSRVWRLAAGFVLLFAVAGCASTTFRGHLLGAADGWSIDVRAIMVGVEVQISGEPSYAVPPDGSRWIWVFMNVRNTAAAPRPFGYDSCELELDQGRVLPSFAGSVISLFKDHQETYGPGEESHRRVIFAYPEGRYPTTFRCGNMLFRIPPHDGAGKPA
jgi:hypothetical protein